MSEVKAKYLDENGEIFSPITSVDSLYWGGGTLKDYLREVIYPIGSVYIINTNTNPSTKFGGTWQLIDKEYSAKIDRLDATIDTTNVSDIRSILYLEWSYCLLLYEYGYKSSNE